MKTTELRTGIITMIVLFLSCLGSFVFANGNPIGNPILEIDNQSYNGIFDPGVGHLLSNDITEFMCEKVEVNFIGIEVDASSGQGQILLAIYENGNLLTHSGYLSIQGGVDELVGFNPSNLEMHPSSTYSLGVMYSSPDPIYFKTSDNPVQLGTVGYNAMASSIDMNSTFPVLPNSLSGVDSLDFNVGFRIQGTVSTTHSEATVFVNSCNEYIAPSGLVIYTTDGIYTDVIPNAVGCDSILTLHVDIMEPVYESVDVNACSVYTWAENNQTYTTSGTYFQQYTGVNGCDSIRVLNLVLHNGSNSITTVSACSSYFWVENGQTYTSSGIYTETYQNSLGCDSIVTLDLDISTPTNDIVDVQACGSYFWEKSGLTYSASGTYIVSEPVDGQLCDDYFQLNLTVYPEIALAQNATACGAYTWPVDGNTYSNSGLYSAYLPSSTGCDTLVTLDLIITEPVHTEDLILTCDTAFTWVNGITYTSNNNTATMVYQSVNGCDSIVTLDLHFYDVQQVTENVISCGPYTWVDGVTYSQSTSGAMPSVTNTNSNGCDQTTFLNLTVLEPTFATHTISACGPYTWIDGNTYTSSNNSATYILTNAAGCDSVVTLDLTIAPIDNSVSVNGIILTSNQPNAQYQWYEDANGLQIIPGATNQSYAAQQNGTYVVEVSQMNCSEMSSGAVIASVGLEEQVSPHVVLYPNPSNGLFTVEGEWSSAVLMDLTGRVIATQSNSGDNKVLINGAAAGKYLMTVHLINGELVVLDAVIE